MIKTEGIVLSKRNSYNEDIFLTLFTEKFGKMNVIVKRAKSYRSALHASTRVFVCSDFIMRPASVPIVTSADIVNSNLKLLDDFEAITNASYLCELVNLTTREEYAERRIYLLLKDGLASLLSEEIDRDLIRAYFVIQLCRELGVMPSLTEEGAFQDELIDMFRRYRLDFDDLPRCIRFLRYLLEVDYSRLRHTKRDSRLFVEINTMGETILKDTLDIADIKSNQLL